MPATRDFWAKPLAPLRYLAVGCLYALMRTLVLLPWRWQIAICSAGGSLMRWLAPGRRRVVATNLELCFPEIDRATRDRLARAHFRALGASLAEMAMGWFGSADRIRSLVEFEGLDRLAAALAKGRGVILYSGHFTSFEITFAAFRPHCRRLCGMYKPQRNPLMNEMMTAGRLRTFDRLFTKDEVREMIRELRANATVWYGADQSFGSKGAALVPFFGEPAMTNTAICRIAKITGSTVMSYFPQRKRDGSGYRVTIGMPIEDFPSDDPVADTRRLIRELEACIRRSPDQYWWVHKRFKGRPPPLPDVYRQGRRAATESDAE